MKRTLMGLLIVALLAGAAVADPFIGTTLRYSIDIKDGCDITALGDTDVDWGTGDVTTTGAGSFGSVAETGGTTGTDATYSGAVVAEHLNSTDDIECADDLSVGDDGDVVGDFTAGTIASDAGVSGTTGTFTDQVTLSKADGTAPLVTTSTTMNENFNADMVDGKDSTDLVLVDGTQGVTGPIAMEKIAIGTTGAYFTDFTTGDNIIGIYANDATCTGYTDGVSSTITAAGGDGNGAIRPIQAAGTASATAVLGELYGGSFYAIQADGSDISGNQYGLMAYTEVEETDEADTADGYITGLLGIYDTNGVNPSVTLTTPGFKAAVGGVVKDNANTQPDAAVMAFLEGDSTGTPAGAAFKAVSVRSSSGGWFNYGLDLYDEAGYGYNIGKADIRLESGAVVMENAGAPTDGATGTGDTYADTGSLLIDTTNGNGYINKGDADSQNWDKVVVDEVESDVTGTYNPVYVTVMQTIANADAVSGSEEYILNDAVLNETVNVYDTFANALTDDVPRALVVDPAASYTGTVTIYGTDMNDAAISEVLTFSSDAAQTTAAAFKDLTNITVSDRTGGGDTTMDVGLGSRIGLNVLLTDTAQVESASMDNVYEATRATITVSATTLSLNTIDPHTANDGTADLKVYMKVVP
jgi:hypothetical protein